MVDPFSYFLFNQCSTTGVTKTAACAVLSGMVHIKEPLLLIGKSGNSRGFLSLSECSFTMSDTT